MLIPVSKINFYSRSVADDRVLSYLLHLTLLDKMGMNVERFGDSTGKLELLSGV